MRHHGLARLGGQLGVRPDLCGHRLHCGHVWVPSRDPKQVPVCAKCKDIYETYRMFNEGLNETPDE
ncbi:MAG: DUF3039 domain-containing protein [Actinomycetota bacterium]